MKYSLRFGILDYAIAFGMFCYAASSMIVSICLIKMAAPDELAFDLTGGGNLQAVRMTAMCVSLVLCGFLGARYGKCHSLIGTMLLMATGLIGCALTPSFGMLFFAMALVGLSDGMLEGLLNPIIQDLHPQNSGKYLNFLNAFWSIGVLSTMIVCGDLLTRQVSWRMLMLGLAVISLLPMLLFIIGIRKHPPIIPAPLSAGLKQVGNILKQGRFWFFAVLMFLCGGGEGGLTFWSASLLQKDFGMAAREGGIGAACFSAGMIIARLAIGVMVKQHQMLRLILSSAIAITMISLVIPGVHSFLGIGIVLFLAGLSTACFWPSLQSYSVDTMPADSTMLFILLSLAGIPGFSAVIWLMGFLGDRCGLRAGFYLIPAVFGIFILLLTGEYLYQRRQRSVAPRTVPPLPSESALSD